MPRRNANQRPQGGNVSRGPYGDANNSVTIEVDNLGQIIALSSSPIVPASVPVALLFAASDEATALTTGTNKIVFRMPYDMTLTGVKASLSTAQTGSGGGGIFTIDILRGGVSILSTLITIDNGEKTSLTAATPPVIGFSALLDDDEMSVSITQIGDGTAKGLKVALIGSTP